MNIHHCVIKAGNPPADNLQVEYVSTTNKIYQPATNGISNVSCVDGSICVLCTGHPSDKVVLVPCGHSQFCSGCIQQMMTSSGCCSICHQRVQTVLQLRTWKLRLRSRKYLMRNWIENSHDWSRCAKKSLEFTWIVLSLTGYKWNIKH